jgi:NAD-dependent deacetylase
MPNAGHYAIARIEQQLGEQFHLITQNIDGLHFRAGSCPERTYEIHGSLEYVRCSRECSKALYPFPNLVKAKDESITAQEWELLKCPKCGNITRPNVL